MLDLFDPDIDRKPSPKDHASGDLRVSKYGRFPQPGSSVANTEP